MLDTINDIASPVLLLQEFSAGAISCGIFTMSTAIPLGIMRHAMDEDIMRSC